MTTRLDLRSILALLAAALLAGCQSERMETGPRAIGPVGTVRAADAAHAWLEIDGPAFEKNIRTVQDLVGEKVQVCAVMKADAYGHGLALLTPSLAAHHATDAGLSVLVCEQEDTGGAILHYPRAKLVLTRPLEIAGHGVLKGPRLSKEQLMDFFDEVTADLNIRRRARVTGVTRREDGVFAATLADDPKPVLARRVLVAVGRRGTPRKLGVPGEEQGKVVYKLIEPERYRGLDVLVVGGGNSAVESALMLAEVGDTRVTLSYRGDAFSRVAAETRPKLDAAVAAGQLQVLLKSTVSRIDFEHVTLHTAEGPLTLTNHAVVVQAGGNAPTEFLRAIGVLVDVHHGIRIVQDAQGADPSPGDPRSRRAERP